MALRDIPPDAAGIPWAVWHEQQIERIFAEAREKRRSAAPEPAEALACGEQQSAVHVSGSMWLLDLSYTSES
ncbi:MAG: hypothetical protein ACRD6B_16795 [Bryobacteraceae bacterium]